MFQDIGVNFENLTAEEKFKEIFEHPFMLANIPHAQGMPFLWALWYRNCPRSFLIPILANHLPYMHMGCQDDKSVKNLSPSVWQ